MDNYRLPEHVATWIGQRIAQDLAEQMLRSPDDAARAAGRATAEDVSAWAKEHRPRHARSS